MKPQDVIDAYKNGQNIFRRKSVGLLIELIEDYQLLLQDRHRQVRGLRKALSLTNSMIFGGESISDEGMLIIQEALEHTEDV